MQMRLGSSPLIHAPGIIKYATTMYKTAQTAEEVKTAIGVFSAWPITIGAMLLILDGEYTVQGSVVVVELDDEDVDRQYRSMVEDNENV